LPKLMHRQWIRRRDIANPGITVHEGVTKIVMGQ
jgi:hypothetical protein